MPLCDAILTTLGVRCAREAGEYPDIPTHLHFCGTHRRVHVDRVARTGQDHQAGRCLQHGGARGWCQHEAEENDVLCTRHCQQRLRIHMRQLVVAERRQFVRETRQNLALEFGNRTWREMAEALALREDPEGVLYEASMSLVLLQGWTDRLTFRRYWLWIEHGRNGPEPEIIAPVAPLPPPRELHHLVRDPQNVHTRVVSEQTNTAMEKLMRIEVPREQQTEKTIVRMWTDITRTGWNDMLRVMNDINKWFNTKTCRQDNDQLYRSLLRGLVATINKTDEGMRPELYKRLWEECWESVGMCCEGHISRLCNVMVGFDDAFRPPVSLGELMQQKMAAIASLDVEEDEKRRQATTWFDENNVPAEQRQAWLEAF